MESKMNKSVNGETSNPYFSVVVPVFNKGPHIARAINSVLNQTFQDFEIVIVCDPSTDNSNEEVAKFNDPRIRAFHRDEPGPGGYAARNLGIKEAKAEWIAFLDADDEWLENHLENLHGVMQNVKSNIYTTSWFDIWPNGIKTKAFTPCENAKQYQKINYVDYVKQAATGNNLCHTNTFSISKKLLIESGGFNTSCKRGGDVTLWLKLVYINQEIICINSYTSIYHREDAGVTVNTAPPTQGVCITELVKKLVKNNNYKSAFHLWRLSNRHIKYGLTFKAKEGKLSITDLKEYKLYANPLSYMFFLSFAPLPSLIQKTIWSIARKIKNA